MKKNTFIPQRPQSFTQRAQRKKIPLRTLRVFSWCSLRLIAVTDSSKTIYENYIPLDSGVENQFAKDCESSEQIEFYFKLPYWFEITTPIGKYRPDWAVVFKNEKRIYFVAETKSAGQELRGSKKLKIECGKAHFENFDDVVYKRVSSVTDLN